MSKIFFLICAISISFCCGFAAKTFLSSPTNEKDFKKVTGIGGIFFKCKDPKKVREWYRDNLGLEVNQYGSVFEWRQALDSTKKGFSQWSPSQKRQNTLNPQLKNS